MSWLSRITNVFRSKRLIDEIDEELESHIAEAIEQGRDPEEARKAFGSSLQRQEESYDIRLSPWLDSLRADLIFGWRQLKKKLDDFSCSRPFTRPCNWSMYNGLSTDRCHSVAAIADIGT